MTNTRSAGSSFVRTRVAAGAIVSAGLLVTLPLLVATPASAVDECNDSNTITSGTAAQIQALIDLNTPAICFVGTSHIETTLNYGYDLTLIGLTDAVLDSDGTGGILQAVENSTLTVDGLRFTNATSDHGAAINGDQVVVRNSAFDHNTAEFAGGAITASTVDVTGSTFDHNSTGLVGGAIWSVSSSVVRSSTFTHNSAGQGGGAIVSYGVLTVTGSTFDTNTANAGGAIYKEDDDLNVTNSTFVTNSAVFGGAILMRRGTVVQTTFLDNVAEPENGNSVLSPGGPTAFRGNIFAGTGANSEVVGDQTEDLGGNVFSATAEIEHSFTTPSASTVFGVAEPSIFDGTGLTNNGGPTQTLALSPTSRAIDVVPAGEPSVTTDQRGVARTTPADAGSFEYVAPPAPDVPAPELAATGPESIGLVGGIAGMLLGAGALLLGARTRTRRRFAR